MTPKKTIMYQMTSDVALLFYQLCEKLQAKTEKERHKILQTIAKLGLMKSVIVTGRTQDEIISDFKKHYKNVLDIRRKENGDNKGVS